MLPHQKIREVRQRIGMTQEAAAKRAKMARTDWVRMESGRHAPSTRTLNRVARALGIEAAELAVAGEREK